MKNRRSYAYYGEWMAADPDCFAEVLVLAAWGIALALPTALLLARLVKTQLYGMSSEDPFPYAIATGVLALVALCAGFVPARRAANTEPMEALRQD